LSWASTNRYRVLFGVSLFFLALLVGRWAIFAQQAAERERNDRYDLLQAKLQVYASLLGSQKGGKEGLAAPEPGMELVQCAELGFGISFPLSPAYPEVCIIPKASLLEEHDRAYRRREVMVVGEGTLAAILVFVIAYMFFKYDTAERRTATELQELWSRVTHEIKTPIAGLKALLQTLQTQDMNRQELEPLLEMALREVDRQERLAENLLIGQRIAGTAFRMKPGPLRIVPWLEGYCAGIQLHAPDANVRTHVVCPEATMVMADPNGLRVILDNLVDNAIKCRRATPPPSRFHHLGGTTGQAPGPQGAERIIPSSLAGEGREGAGEGREGGLEGGTAVGLALDVSLALEHNRVRLAVADNGPGFDPSKAEAIFEAYRRLDDELPTARRGTGMGLHISRRLAKEMRGGLTAVSRGPGTGATFTLTLRVVEVA